MKYNQFARPNHKSMTALNPRIMPDFLPSVSALINGSVDSSCRFVCGEFWFTQVGQLLAYVHIATFGEGFFVVSFDGITLAKGGQHSTLRQDQYT